MIGSHCSPYTLCFQCISSLWGIGSLAWSPGHSGARPHPAPTKWSGTTWGSGSGGSWRFIGHRGLRWPSWPSGVSATSPQVMCAGKWGPAGCSGDVLVVPTARAVCRSVSKRKLWEVGDIWRSRTSWFSFVFSCLATFTSSSWLIWSRDSHAHGLIFAQSQGGAQRKAISIGTLEASQLLADTQVHHAW